MENRPIGMELRKLSLHMKRYMESHSNCKIVDKLTGSSSWIIAYIGEEKNKDVFQKDLEKKFGITRSTASKTVDAMVKNGFIERSCVDYDARLKILVLTKKALDILDIMDRDRRNIEEVLTAGFSDKEKEKLHGYIVRMTRNLESCSEDKV